jgi:hypothetical protein
MVHRLLASILLAAPLLARILDVPEDYPIIQGALDASSSGDTVLVGAGRWVENLVLPTHDLTLASHWLMNQDTMAVDSTILDGGGIGTVIWVPDGDYAARVAGFRIENGRGLSDWTSSVAGGIYLMNVRKVTLERVVLRDNYANHSGTAISSKVFENSNDYLPDSLIMKYIKIETNNTLRPDPGNDRRVDILFDNFAELYSVSLVDSGDVAGAMIYGNSERETEMIANKICVRDFFGRNLAIALYAEKMYCRDLSILNSKVIGDMTDSMVSLVSGESGLNIEKLHIQGNDHINNGNNTIRRICTLYGDWIQADSLVFKENRTSSGLVAGHIEADSFGVVRNLVVEDNESGGLGLGHEGVPHGQIMTMRGCSLVDFRFARNTSWMPVGCDTPEQGLVLDWYGSEVNTDSLGHPVNYIRRGVFEDNRQVFADDPISIEGRVLMVNAADGTTVAVEQLRLQNNTMEPLYTDVDYSATMNLAGDEGALMTLKDIQLIDNSAGGIVAYAGDLTVQMENITIRRPQFRGLVLITSGTGETELSNVWIDSLDTIGWCTPPYSWCSLVGLLLNARDPDGEDVKNLTMTNCRSAILVGAPTLSVSHPTPGTRFWNCLFDQNTYADFVGNYSDNPRTPYFGYCMLPEDISQGDSNLIGLDPQFDERLGAPFLGLDSPAVDAGKPNDEWNDLEDPAHPGFPLWPSLGTLRNDIGVTGGPYAVPLDTTYVSVPHWEPGLPKSFSLGAPWPNPFNPVTRIPFTLTRPEMVKLSVHNLLGQEVAVLAHGVQFAGRHEVRWDAGSLASGVYVVQLDVGGKTKSRTVTLLR